MLTLDTLSKQLSYLEPGQVEQVRSAYTYADNAHVGQTRKTGEPYITHPLAAAAILAEMRLDYQSIIAALLHDVIEDTPATYEDVQQKFGKEVAHIVEGVSKLELLDFNSHAELKASNFQKMVLAMANDIRVILVKLADRLHNMRTLDAMRPDKQRRIANETLEIYSPIAGRLGMNKLQMELEELAFAAYYPMRSTLIDRAVKTYRGQHQDVISEISSTIEQKLKQQGIDYQVLGREKHLYSIYKKMKTKSRSFSEIMDIFALRIITKDQADCYRVLGEVHHLYKPVPGRFKDYIAIPKSNGYQSLHTDLFGPKKITIEVQIRSEMMDIVATRGVAEHSHYKSNIDLSDTAIDSYKRARKWVEGLLEMQKNATSSMDFIDNAKLCLFPEEVYVFTPQGKIIELPSGSTAIDFAYAIHTDIGNSAIACKIDREPLSLSRHLRNGQTVEILSREDAQPNIGWLKFAMTGKARTAIRHFFNNQEKHRFLETGQRLLNHALAKSDSTLEDVNQTAIDQYLADKNYQSFDDVLVDIGMGRRQSYLVASHLKSIAVGDDDKKDVLAIHTNQGIQLEYADCCHPVRDDWIVGHMLPNQSMMIHRSNCKKIQFDEHAEKFIYLEWLEDLKGNFVAEIACEAEAVSSLMMQLAQVIIAANTEIQTLHLESKVGTWVKVKIEIIVRDRVHLAQAIKAIRTLKSVHKVKRI